MGKFKDFILSESIGLGDLGTRIDHLFHSHKFGDQIAGAFASSDVTGSEQPPSYIGRSLHLPSTDLTIPSVVKQGRITVLQMKRNPIYVRLSDGTEAHFTYDEFQRIQGKPDVGKTMTLTFQRHPEDKMREYSKIDSAIVSD
jgi:hypothetical protein